MLYIDDLFKGDSETPSKQDIKLAFDLISSRYDSQLPTIISSERTIADIVKIDESIASRIVERCGRDRLLAIRKNRKSNFRTEQNGQLRIGGVQN